MVKVVQQLFSVGLCLLAWSSFAADTPLLVYDSTPEEIWRVQFSPIGPGNGAFLSKDEDMLVVVAATGRVRAYDPMTSNVLWTFTPPLDPNTVSCKSGVKFVETLTDTYLAYAVTQDTGENITSFIFGIHYNGTLFFETEPMPGTSAGTPQATRDGRYLAITHNDDQLGYFSFFDTNDLLDANETLPLEPLLEYESTLLSFNETTPFSELGYFARPDEGYYGSDDNNGLNNDNDIFLWISDTNTNVLNVNGVPMAGEGQMYVFQLPKDYDHSGNGLEVIPIGPVRGYQAATRPILTNGGKSMYWSMVRGETRSWDGRLFSRSHNGRNNTQRGDPPYIGARAAPSLNSDSSRVFGPGPSNDVWSAGRNMEDFDSVSTDGIVSAQLLVTLDDQFVLWGTENGQLTMASAFDLSQQAWQIGDFSDIPFDSIQGEMARDSSGTMIFVTTTFDNIAGTIIALRIANEAEPPSSSPSSYPSSTPSLRPSVAPSSSSQEPTFIEFLEVPTDPPVGSEATVGPTAQAPMTSSSSSTIKKLSLWSYIGIVVAIAFVFLG